MPVIYGALTAPALTQASGEHATGSQQTTFDAMGMFIGLLTDPFMQRDGAPSVSPGQPAFADADDEALGYAAKDHKRVLLVFGGNWCYDCHVLDTTFRSKAFAPLVNANYHVIHINVGSYDTNLDLAKKYEIPLEKGVPSLAILDPDDTLVVSQKKGEFESTVRIGPEDVAEFLKKWKPQPKS